jgi:hypothetical protein
VNARSLSTIGVWITQNHNKNRYKVIPLYKILFENKVYTQAGKLKSLLGLPRGIAISFLGGRLLDPCGGSQKRAVKD